MANIPVERSDGGLPWWAWLLGLLALLLIGSLLLSQCDNEEDDVVETDVTVVDDDVSTAGDFTDLDLSDVYVTRVVGDNTFFVSPTRGGTDETLVYIEEEATPGTATEGRYDVTEGQHLSITGTMASTPADLTPWGLTADQATTVGDQYVRATSLTVLDAATGADAMGGDAAGATGAAGGAITSLADLNRMMNDTAAGNLAGRSVTLTNVAVSNVVGDSTFFLGTGADRVLVVLENLGESESGDGTGSDGVFNVDDGDTITLNGRVERYSGTMRGMSGLTAADRSAAEGRRYVVVTKRDGLSM